MEGTEQFQEVGTEEEDKDTGGSENLHRYYSFFSLIVFFLFETVLAA